MSNPEAHLRGGRKWVFAWGLDQAMLARWGIVHEDYKNGWYYQTRENIYRLFLEETPAQAGFDIWVGRYDQGSRSWYTVEARLGITHIEWFRGRVVFNRGRGSEQTVVAQPRK